MVIPFCTVRRESPGRGEMGLRVSAELQHYQIITLSTLAPELFNSKGILVRDGPGPDDRVAGSRVARSWMPRWLITRPGP
jgi:hypothetical protein